MKNLLQCAVFVTLESQLLDIANRIQSANVVHLMAPADVEGVLALSQLESALLDNSKNYFEESYRQENMLVETIRKLYQR